MIPLICLRSPTGLRRLLNDLVPLFRRQLGCPLIPRWLDHIATWTSIDPHASIGRLVEALRGSPRSGPASPHSAWPGGRALPSLCPRAIFDMMQRLDLTDNERAVLIAALRRLVDFDPRSLSPQTHALKAILERLEPHKSQPIPDTAGTG